jgi:hypothetical protein
MERTLRKIDVLRHELKALRYLLDSFHQGGARGEGAPSREDFQADQSRLIYDAIVEAGDRQEAEARIAVLKLEDVDLHSFLGLSGQHYYSYPDLVRKRAEAIRSGELVVEDS